MCLGAASHNQHCSAEGTDWEANEAYVQGLSQSPGMGPAVCSQRANLRCNQWRQLFLSSPPAPPSIFPSCRMALEWHKVLGICIKKTCVEDASQLNMLRYIYVACRCFLYHQPCVGRASRNNTTLNYAKLSRVIRGGQRVKGHMVI